MAQSVRSSSRRSPSVAAGAAVPSAGAPQPPPSDTFVGELRPGDAQDSEPSSPTDSRPVLQRRRAPRARSATPGTDGHGRRTPLAPRGARAGGPPHVSASLPAGSRGQSPAPRGLPQSPPLAGATPRERVWAQRVPSLALPRSVSPLPTPGPHGGPAAPSGVSTASQAAQDGAASTAGEAMRPAPSWLRQPNAAFAHRMARVGLVLADHDRLDAFQRPLHPLALIVERATPGAFDEPLLPAPLLFAEGLDAQLFCETLEGDVGVAMARHAWRQGYLLSTSFIRRLVQPAVGAGLVKLAQSLDGLAFAHLPGQWLAAAVTVPVGTAACLFGVAAYAMGEGLAIALGTLCGAVAAVARTAWLVVYLGPDGIDALQRLLPAAFVHQSQLMYVYALNQTYAWLERCCPAELPGGPGPLPGSPAPHTPDAPVPHPGLPVSFAQAARLYDWLMQSDARCKETGRYLFATDALRAQMVDNRTVQAQEERRSQSEQAPECAPHLSPRALRVLAELAAPPDEPVPALPYNAEELAALQEVVVYAARASAEGERNRVLNSAFLPGVATEFVRAAPLRVQPGLRVLTAATPWEWSQAQDHQFTELRAKLAPLELSLLRGNWNPSAGPGLEARIWNLRADAVALAQEHVEAALGAHSADARSLVPLIDKLVPKDALYAAAFARRFTLATPPDGPLEAGASEPSAPVAPRHGDA